MANVVSASEALANGHWLLAHPSRGAPRPVSIAAGAWWTKRAGWNAAGEAGGFVGQCPLASGAPPRGDQVLWQYDPDGGIEVLDGEIRVERAFPMPIDDIAIPGNLSWFACRSPFIVTSVGGTADVRFISAAPPIPKLTACHDLIATHFQNGYLLSKFHLQSFPFVPLSIGGLADFRKSTVAGNPTDTAAGLSRFEFHDLQAMEIVGPRRKMTITALGNVDLSSARSYLDLELNVDGNATLAYCTRGLRLRANSYVGGHLDLTGSALGKLEEDLTIGGDLILTGTRLKSKPDSWVVSGEVIV